MADVRFLLTGDTSVTVEFGNEISTEINAKIRAFNIALENSKIPGIIETVPTYRSLMVHYDPGVIRLERKEKNGSLTRKTGQTISVADAEILTGSRPRPVLTGLAEELQRRCLLEGFRPRVLVDYDRTPFVCADGNTRITLDENLRTRPYDTKLFASEQAMIPVLEPDQVILEVKFDDFLPGYLGEILSDIPKAQMSVSKYVLCMNLT